jgi:hypothetical protein
MIDTGIFMAIHKPTGKIVTINEVTNGNACDCKCINCCLALQARQGEARRHHFKHISGTECSLETILHKLAKQIFKEHSYTILPEGKGRFDYTTVEEEV